MLIKIHNNQFLNVDNIDYVYKYDTENIYKAAIGDRIYDISESAYNILIEDALNGQE